ncbi:MAG: hypothetical protein K8I00_00840 [Candidatus Omnitrophica bacterium]|nr:hypothetical protein [Candidatus Omnitrophota bacterium]
MANLQIPFWMTHLSTGYAARTPVSMGIDDALNIFPITWSLIFLFFMIHLVRSKWNIIFSGLLFVVIQIMGLIALVHGNLDPFLIRPQIYLGLKIFWACTGCALLILGGVYLRDWMTLRRDPQAKLWIGFPQYDNKDGKSGDLFIVKLFMNLFYLFLAAVLGAVSVVSSAFTLQDYDVFIMLLDTKARYNVQIAEQQVMKYIGAYLLPSIGVVFLAVLFSFFKGIRNVLGRRLVLIKLTISMIYFGLGAGAIITILKM